MKLKKLKPTTNGVRHQINIQKNLLSKNNRIFRSTIKGYKSCSGRSSMTGHITSWHKSGGHKILFRNIDFVYLIEVKGDFILSDFIEKWTKKRT